MKVRVARKYHYSERVAKGWTGDDKGMLVSRSGRIPLPPKPPPAPWPLHENGRENLHWNSALQDPSGHHVPPQFMDDPQAASWYHGYGDQGYGEYVYGPYARHYIRGGCAQGSMHARYAEYVHGRRSSRSRSRSACSQRSSASSWSISSRSYSGSRSVYSSQLSDLSPEPAKTNNVSIEKQKVDVVKIEDGSETSV